MERKNTWETYDKKQLKALEKLNADYREFLDHGKTERECIDVIVNTIEAAGYKELESLIESGAQVKPGDKVYSVWMNKSIAMYHIGKKPMVDGMNILGAHIDSPRIDVKQNPLYEDNGFAYLDTHYYGGIKKYQWVAQPLAIHGVVVKKDGTCVEINVGENPDDPVFFISDLLIHLAGEQLEKKAAKVIEGEALDLIIGNKPLVIKKEEKAEEKEEKDSKAKAKEGVKGLKENSSMLIVSQRISTIMDADEIIVLDEGEIIDKGSHDYLNENCSIYREIVSSQIERSEELLYDDEESSNFIIDTDYIKKTTGGK